MGHDLCMRHRQYFGMGLVCRVHLCTLGSDGAIGVNVALAFNMGTDIESILASPIAQPLATVGRS
jgi:hypothetical protein